MMFEKYVLYFEEYLKISNYSESTIFNYKMYLNEFVLFIEKYYPRIQTLQKITKDIIIDYQNNLVEQKNRKGEPLSNSTKIFKLKSIKKFFLYLVKNDYLLNDPSSAITMPKQERKLIRNVLTEKEVFELLANSKLTNPISIRNRAIIELFYGCGIRTSELCNLRIEDVDLQEQTVTVVKGKGGKSRLIPIGQYSCYYIKLYLKKARNKLLKYQKKDPGKLFLSYRGKPFNKTSINKNVIRQVLRNVNIKKHVSCYTFRHSVATHLLKNNVDIMYIAQLLGHSSLKTTQQYLKIEISDLKKMHSLYHPRERITIGGKK